MYKIFNMGWWHSSRFGNLLLSRDLLSPTWLKSQEVSLSLRLWSYQFLHSIFSPRYIQAVFKPSANCVIPHTALYFIKLSEPKILGLVELWFIRAESQIQWALFIPFPIRASQCCVSSVSLFHDESNHETHIPHTCTVSEFYFHPMSSSHNFALTLPPSDPLPRQWAKKYAIKI